MTQISISQESIVALGVIIIMIAASLIGIKSCDMRLQRDRVLCEKFSKSIEEYDNCMVSRKRVER